MLKFKLFLESLSNQKRHFNISIAGLKGLTFKSPNKQTRFLISHVTGKINAGDASNTLHMHLRDNPNSHDGRDIEGFIHQHTDGEYHMNILNGNKEKYEHPTVQRMLKHGIKNTNVYTP